MPIPWSSRARSPCARARSVCLDTGLQPIRMSVIVSLGVGGDPIYVLLGYIYGFIGACSLFALSHPRIRRPEGARVRNAILSWWPVSLVGGLMVILGSAGALIIFAFVSMATLREYVALLPTHDRHPTLSALAYLAVPLHYALILTHKPALIYGGIVVWGALVLPLVRLWLCGTKDFLAGSARLLFGLLLTVLSLSHVVMIFWADSGVMPAGPEGLASLLLLLVMASDAGQYVAGKLAGKTLLVPVISPHKTFEGLLGGAAITALVGAASAPLISPLDRWTGAFIGVGICFVGLLGDLLISAIKRDAGVKDTGSALPGQGGVLDRCDSMLLTAPLFLYLYATPSWLQ